MELKIGQKFGNLTIVNTAERKRYYVCECSCGTVKEIRGDHLLSGNTTSCGCLRRQAGQRMAATNFPSPLDLTGQRFGRLVVIRPEGQKYERTAWLCQCDCGNQVIIAGKSLRAGRTQSCGCYKQDQNAETARRNFTTHGKSSHPDYRRWHKHRRYHADRLWTKEMEDAFYAFFKSCVRCGSAQFEIDHVVPVTKNGVLLPGNAVALCRKCNNWKKAKKLAELPQIDREIIEKAAKGFENYWNLTSKNKPK